MGPEGTHNHMVWQQIRAEALKQKKQRRPAEEGGEMEKDWRRRWQIRACDLPASPASCHVVTVNVGPRGLAVCLGELPSLVVQHDTAPMVIHLQDIRITPRRFKTLRDRIKKVMPDYTPYAFIKRCKGAKRYQMGVMTLLRNDVAHSAEQVPVTHFAPADDTAGVVENGAAPRAALEVPCAGRVLVLKTKPPGGAGEVWHINVYQHTANAPAATRAAVWEACSNVIREAEEQGAAVIVGGDLNAAVSVGQRGGKTSGAD